MALHYPVFKLTCILFVLFCHYLGTEGANNERKTPYTSTKGHACISPCERRGGIEYWCHVEKSGWLFSNSDWVHCSPNEGVTYLGDTCTSPCSLHNKDYYFCYTDSNKRKWDYCGKIVNEFTPPTSTQHFTRKGVPCTAECKFPADDDESRCPKVGGSWDYCSIKPEHTIKGRKCNSKCAYSDDKTSQWFTYTWCWLNEEAEEWDYCSKVTLADSSSVVQVS